MLTLSTASNLAIHSMAYLASVETEKPVSAAHVARVLDASPSHLGKVLQGLAKQGLITSVRGARGGFSLARDPRKIDLLEIVRAVVGPFPDDLCLLGRRICRPGDCKLQLVRLKVKHLVERELGSMTLAKFVKGRSASDPRTRR